MADPWYIVGASVAGTKHQRSGKPCEDAWDMVAIDDLTACCVADGAGSAPAAAIGAHEAVSAAIVFMTEHHRRAGGGETPAAELVKEAVIAAARSIEQRAAADGRPVEDLNTTLTVGAMTSEQIAVAQIGDCFAVVHDRERYRIIAYPESERRFVEETEFLTVERAHNVEPTTIELPTDGRSVEFALSTDGLAPLLLDRWSPPIPHDPFFQSLFRALDEERASQADLERFLGSPEVCQRTDDDKTLVLAKRTS